METDRLNEILRLVLLVGMLLSVGVLILGLLMFSLCGAGWEETTLSLGEIAEGLMEGNPVAVIDLGILLLIATPLTRVIASLVVFLMEGERKFVAVALAVLTVVSMAVLVGG